MIVNEYELVLILRPDIDEATGEAALEKIESVIAENGGTLLVRDDWGQRRLAYLINGHQKGRYVLEKFIADPSIISEVERRLRITDSVIRFMTVRKPGSVDVEARLAEAEEERRKLAEDAARRAAEAAAEAEAIAAAEAAKAERAAETNYPQAEA